MPIRPENRKRYPADWPAISLRIRFARAAGQCECNGECGHPARCRRSLGATRARGGGLVSADDDGWLGDPDNGYDESADREEWLADWPDGEVDDGR